MKRKRKSKNNLIKLKNGTRIYLANLSHHKDSENKFYFTLPLLNPNSWDLTKEDRAFVKEVLRRYP
jgi:hypothetical protein